MSAMPPIVTRIYRVTFNATLVALACLAVLLSSPNLSSADPLDTWHLRNPLLNSALNGITYGNGIFVAVGSEGTIVTSTDGKYWLARKSGTTNSLLNVAYLNDMFVAVGAGTILTSRDGVSWTLRYSAPSVSVRAVAYGNNRFVAVGNNNPSSFSTFNTVILTSTDGVTWSQQQSPTGYSLNGVAYGNGIFVTVGTDSYDRYGKDIILTSPDGLNWTVRQQGDWPTMSGVAFGNGIFVAAGGDGVILSSADGLSWTNRGVSGSDIASVTYANGLFLAPSYIEIATSPDGIGWTGRPGLGLSAGISAIAYGGRNCCAVLWQRPFCRHRR
jgi:hypothetical protein